MEDLALLSEEQLIERYELALTQRDLAIENLRCLEDEHFKRNFGAVSLRWLVEYKSEEAEASLVR